MVCVCNIPIKRVLCFGLRPTRFYRLEYKPGGLDSSMEEKHLYRSQPLLEPL